MLKDFKKGITHAGTFHADDVFATALLKSVNPSIDIERTFQVPDDVGSDTIVYDVGGGKYDHHESEDLKEKREDGTFYAAFGKIWRDYGAEVTGSKEAALIVENTLVKYIDHTDNTGERNPLSSVIHAYNPTWEMDGSPQALNSAFFKAVDTAKVMLNNQIEHAKAAVKAKQIVRESQIHNKNVLVFNQYIPPNAWQDVILNEMPDVDFVVFPSNRGGYNVQKVPLDFGSTDGRVDFPKEWCGYRVETDDSRFDSVKQIDGLTFCHPGNFLASVDTLENAINVAHKAANEGKRNNAKMTKEDRLKRLSELGDFGDSDETQKGLGE